MSMIQRFIDNASSIEMIKRRINAQTITRSGRLLSQSVASGVPWMFRIEYNRVERWEDIRALLAQWDNFNITVTQFVNIGADNPNLSYLTEYQGDLSTAQLAGLRYAQSVGTGSTILLDTTLTTGSGKLFRAGDLISVDGFEDVYEVVSDVNFVSATDLPVQVHRPFINRNPGLTALQLNVGPAVTFEVRMLTMPKYQIVAPGLVQFTDPIEMMEVL